MGLVETNLTILMHQLTGDLERIALLLPGKVELCTTGYSWPTWPIVSGTNSQPLVFYTSVQTSYVPDGPVST